jgi:quercetin 2,3-dioxygenase
MNSILHKANTRGEANHGWLHSFHSFSFSGYYNPERMNFGAIRVLNDDIVTAGMGFGTHPHNNMEIISIPLFGDLKHKDSMGNETIISQGDIQIMSAGTGISHSEYNKNHDKEVRFLQIWIVPNQQNLPPRYDQISLVETDRINVFQEVVSPSGTGNSVAIRQNAWLYLGKFTESTTINHAINQAENGIYIFVLQGEILVNNQLLSKRDGFGVWNISSISINVNPDTEVLLIEVPMKF